MSLFFFHVNACFLIKSFNDKGSNNNSYMIVIPEKRITKKVFLLIILNLHNYSKEFCRTETSGNCTLLYIHSDLP